MGVTSLHLVGVCPCVRACVHVSTSQFSWIFTLREIKEKSVALSTVFLPDLQNDAAERKMFPIRIMNTNHVWRWWRWWGGGDTGASEIH